MSDADLLLRPDWPAPAAVHAVCSTRRGGVSAGVFDSLNLGRSTGDDGDKVDENRRRLVAAAGAPTAPRWIRQLHGTAVVRMPGTPDTPEADGVWTDAPGTVIAVQAADCLPVLFCDDGGRVVAAAHAGWRGLAAGVLEATVAALPVPPSRLMAWLGPAIGPEAFEVGEEVRAAFVGGAPADGRDGDVDVDAASAFHRGPGGRWHADLFALARLRLRRCGVTRVFGGGISTHADPARFYSHRRDGRTGRMAALIWIGSAEDTERPDAHGFSVAHADAV